MTSAHALAVLFDTAPGSLFEFDHLDAVFGDELAPLRSSGLLVEAHSAHRASCFECGDVHGAVIEHDAQGRPAFFCAAGGGWIDVSAPALRRQRFDHDAFLRALATALGANGRIEAIVAGACWRLGSIERQGEPFLPIAVREMDDACARAQAIDSLRHLGKWRGVVVCGAPPAGATRIHSRFETIALDALVAVNEHGCLEVDELGFQEALGLRRRGRGAHGAGWDHPELNPLIDERFRSGQNMSRAAAEADWLLAHRAWMRSEKPAPSRPTLARHIKRCWDQLARTN